MHSQRSRTITRLFAGFALVGALATAIASGQAPDKTQRPPTKAETDRNALLMHGLKAGPAGFVGDPYPLDHCIVGGEKLGPDTVTVILKDVDAHQEGRQLKFCCAACTEKYKAQPRAYQPKLDAEIIALQAPTYPLDHCLVMLDEKLDDECEQFVFGNRLFKLCCKKCLNNFLKNTEKYVTGYERELMVKQRKAYPLDTCVVTGAKLPEKPYDFVIAARLVRVTDQQAAKKVLEDPATYLAKIDEAKAAKPKG